jgi:hypothetical protein
MTSNPSAFADPTVRACIAAALDDPDALGVVRGASLGGVALVLTDDAHARRGAPGQTCPSALRRTADADTEVLLDRTGQLIALHLTLARPS